MNLRPIYLLLPILFITFLQAQINPKTKWGNVSQAEIDYKQVPFEKDAGAVILYEEGGILITDILSEKTVYQRIKILNDSGIRWANKEFIYYSHKGSSYIDGIKAQTINFDNGTRTISQVDKKSIFQTNLNEYYSSYKFAFPNVKVGSILELEYKISEKNLYYLDAWKFQHEIPTLYSKFSFINNSFIDFRSIAIGDKIVKLTKGKKDPEEWTLRDLTSFYKIPYAYNVEDTAEQIKFQIQGYLANSYRIKDNIEYVEAIRSWTKLIEVKEKEYKFLRNNASVRELPIYFKNNYDPINNLKKILDYFNTNYRVNGFTSINPQLNNRSLIEKKVGNAADLNLLLNTILTENDYDAKLVMLSTRNHGKIVTSYPYLGQFDTFINFVTLKDGSTYFIDASDLTNGLGYPPLRNNNLHGLIVDSKQEKFISVEPHVSEFYLTQNYLFKDGKFILTKTEKSNGYFNSNRKDFSNNVKNSIDKNYNEKSKTNPIVIEDNYIGIKTVYESDFTENFYTIQNPLVKEIGRYRFEEIYRERPLEFDFPLYYKFTTVVNIPAGYTVEIPQNFNVNHQISNRELIYLQNAEVKDGSIILNVEFLMTKPIFFDKYQEVKSFFEKSNLDAAKTILLKKI